MFCWLLVLAPHGDQSELLRCFVVVSASCLSPSVLGKTPGLFQLRGALILKLQVPPSKKQACSRALCNPSYLFLHLQEHQHSHHLGPIDGKQETHVLLELCQTPSMHSHDHALLNSGPMGQDCQLTQKIKGWIFKSYKRPSAAIHSPCRL